jgi:N-acyl-D-aspartate/D-glutamate deacylase
VSFTLTQHSHQPEKWYDLIERLEAANRDGLTIKAQGMPRPIGILLGLDLTLNPFAFHPGFRAIEKLPLAQKVGAMRDPELRSRLLSETSEDPNAFFKSLVDDIEWLFPLGDPPNYHPEKDDSIAARARRDGLDPHEVIYDELLRDEGRAVLYRPSANREGERFETVGSKILKHPDALLGLGDGGAHYGMICDAGLPTYLLLHWVGHDDPEKRVALAQAVRMLAHDTAQAVGLGDRGRIAPGLKGDINVIDMNRLHLHAPRPMRDLPAGGRRLTQQADGYVATIVSGEVTYREGQPTGALPGRLVRGARQAAHA